MADSCASCFFGQTSQDAPVDMSGSGKKVMTRVCARRAPLAINMASGPTPILFAPVSDDHWCGEGQDNATGRPFAVAAPPGAAYTVATLPPPQAGLRLFVTDSRTTNFGSTVNGGGNNFVPVFGNNAGQWVVG